MQSITNYEKEMMPVAAQGLLENKVEAMRALATLMLREVDSIERSAPEHASRKLLESEFSLHSEMQRYEADLIRSALMRTGGRQRHAARLLGVKVTTLNSKIKKYEINWKVVGVESGLAS